MLDGRREGLAEIAVSTVLDARPSVELVRFVCFDERTQEIYDEVLHRS